MKKNKWFSVVLMLAAFCMVFGVVDTVKAARTENIWAYKRTTDNNKNIVYNFPDISIKLPASWKGKYKIEKAQGYLEFYHAPTRQTVGTGAGGGTLFVVSFEETYNFKNRLPSYMYSIIGQGNNGVYYFPTIQGELGDVDNPETYKEFINLQKDIEWIEKKAIVRNGRKMYVTSKVNVRQNASVSSASLGAVAKGSKILVTGIAEKGWIPVNYKGNKGYISAKYLSSSSQKKMYTTAKVNIRKSASMKGAVLGSVPKGRSVTVTGNAKNGWYPVTYGGLKGYISKNYLSAAK